MKKPNTQDAVKKVQRVVTSLTQFGSHFQGERKELFMWMRKSEDGSEVLTMFVEFPKESEKDSAVESLLIAYSSMLNDDVILQDYLSEGLDAFRDGSRDPVYRTENEDFLISVYNHPQTYALRVDLKES